MRCRTSHGMRSGRSPKCSAGTSFQAATPVSSDGTWYKCFFLTQPRHWAEFAELQSLSGNRRWNFQVGFERDPPARRGWGWTSLLFFNLLLLASGRDTVPCSRKRPLHSANDSPEFTRNPVPGSRPSAPELSYILHTHFLIP